MEHKGEIIERAVRESGMPITKITKKLGKSRRWMYQVFEQQNVSSDIILEIGNIIHYDFSKEIKTINKFRIVDASIVDSGVASEPPTDYWKQKYYELLEENHQLLLDQQKASKSAKRSKGK